MSIQNGITISESGFTFGPFSSSDLFWLEKSSFYLGLPDSHGVKMAEFAWVKISGSKCMTYVVEAQNTFPRPGNSKGAIQELKEKFSNAMALIAALSEQCEGVRVLLKNGLRSITCLWALNDPAIVVMNRQIAIKQGLIIANASS